MKRKLIFLASQNLSCCSFSFTKLFQMNTFEGIPLEYRNSVCEIEGQSSKFIESRFQWLPDTVYIAREEQFRRTQPEVLISGFLPLLVRLLGSIPSFPPYLLIPMWSMYSELCCRQAIPLKLSSTARAGR